MFLRKLQDKIHNSFLERIYLMGGRKEARQGLNAERILIDWLNNKFFLDENHLKACEIKGIEFPENPYALKPKNRKKCDIKVISGSGNNSSLCITLKTITNASFHQIDRRWLDKWARILDMPQNIYDIFIDAIKRVAENGNACFILPKDREIVKEFLNSNLTKIMKEIFKAGEEDVKVLAIYNVATNKICFFDLGEVIEYFAKSEITFSNKGIIKIGEFITIQRKGGNRSHIRMKKTDLRHPGNQLQFKFKPLEFMKSCVNYSIIKKTCCFGVEVSNT
jgi:hypothetical protein